MRYRPTMVLLVVMVALSVAAAALVTTYLTSRVELRHEIEKQALALAESAAEQLNTAANARAYKSRSFTDPDYVAIEQNLRHLRDMWRNAGINVRYVFTLVPDASSRTGLNYAVDAEDKREEKSAIGSSWLPLRSEVGAFDFTKAQAFGYTDAYGTFFGGFAPIKDEAGNVLAVVGVDLDGRVISDASARIVYMALGPLALLILVSLAAIGLLGERLVRPLEALRAFAERVGSGDLTAQANAAAPGEAGSIARALNATLTSLRVTVRNADDTAERVHEVCQRLLSTGGDRRATMHAATQQTSDAARRAHVISEQAIAVARDARAAGSAARQAVDVGAQMLANVQEIDTGMRAVIDRGQELASSLQAMRQRAATVDAALEALVQVANRSSVLSLNAEIEANQAGDAGRGFAVVAREIRRLAEQAAASSLQIERNVAGMHEALDAGARATEGFSTAAEQASAQSARLSSSIAQSIRQLEGLSPSLQAVGESCEQFQSEGRSMSNGLGQAESAVTELRAFLEQSEATLEELRVRSQEVHRLLSQLKTA